MPRGLLLTASVPSSDPGSHRLWKQNEGLQLIHVGFSVLFKRNILIDVGSMRLFGNLWGFRGSLGGATVDKAIEWPSTPAPALEGFQRPLRGRPDLPATSKETARPRSAAGSVGGESYQNGPAEAALALGAHSLTWREFSNLREVRKGREGGNPGLSRLL